MVKIKSALGFIGLLVILVIIVVSFVIAPSLGMGGSNVITFGRYGQQPIDYARGSNFLNLIEQYQRANSDMPAFMQRFLWQYAFSQAMLAAAWAEESQRAGIVVGNRLLGLSLSNEGFTHEILAGLSIVDHETIVNRHTQLIRSNIMRHNVSSVTRSNNFLNFASNPAGISRSADIAIFYADNYPDSAAISFAQANLNLFRQANLSVLFIEAGRTEAEQLRNSLINNEFSFFDAPLRSNIVYHSINNQPQYLFEVEQILLDDQLAAGVFNLTVGGVSQLLPQAGIDNLFVLYQLEEAPVTPDFTSETTINMVKNYLLTHRRSHVADHFLAEAALIDRTNFAVSAAALGATILHTPFFSPVFGLEVNQFNPSPYDSLVENFTQIFAQQDARLANALRHNRAFFSAVFAGGLNAQVNSLVIDNDFLAIIAVLPTAEQNFTQQLTGLDDYLNHELLTLVEQNFRDSPRWRDNFERGYTTIFGPEQDAGFNFGF